MLPGNSAKNKESSVSTFGLSKSRRISWYAGSATFGAFMIWFVLDKGLLEDPETAPFELVVVLLSWGVVVALLRLVCRDMKLHQDSEAE